jgi:hypothetical protein
MISWRMTSETAFYVGFYIELEEDGRNMLVAGFGQYK